MRIATSDRNVRLRCSSRLVNRFIPSRHAFSIKYATEAVAVDTAGMDTLRFIRHVVPAAMTRKAFSEDPIRRQRVMTLKDFGCRNDVPLHSTEISAAVNHRLLIAAAGTVDMTITNRRARFQARVDGGYELLNDDLKRYVFELAAREALDDPVANEHGVSFQVLKTLRSLCKLSYEVMEEEADSLMRKLAYAVTMAHVEPTVKRAIAVRDLFVPRGLSVSLMERKLQNMTFPDGITICGSGGLPMMCLRLRIDTVPVAKPIAAPPTLELAPTPAPAPAPTRRSTRLLEIKEQTSYVNISTLPPRATFTSVALKMNLGVEVRSIVRHQNHGAPRVALAPEPPPAASVEVARRTRSGREFGR